MSTDERITIKRRTPKIEVRNRNDDTPDIRTKNALVAQDYEAEIQNIIRRIPQDATDEQKLRVIFDWFVSNVTFDNTVYSRGTYNHLFRDRQVPYKYNTMISVGQKECPILCKIGVCASQAAAVKDICDKIGIVCKIATNETYGGNINRNISAVSHAINVVTIDGHEKVVDTVDHKFLEPLKPGMFTMDGKLQLRVEEPGVEIR